MSKNRGAPLKLRDPELRKRICGYVRSGEKFEVACAAAGICRSTFARWQRVGFDARKKAEAGEKLTRTERLFLQFSDAIETSKAEGRVAMVQVLLRSALDQDWRAAAFLLERRHPETWGRRDQVTTQLSGPDGGALSVNVNVPMSPVVRERIAFAYREKIKREVRREERDKARAKVEVERTAAPPEPKAESQSISPAVEAVEPAESPKGKADVLV